MFILLFLSHVASIQYCITTNAGDTENTCDCHGYTEVFPENFNENTIFGNSTVELFFCIEFNQKLNISNINQQLIINSARKIDLHLNLSLLSNTASLTFQNVNIIVENWISGILNVNSLYLFQSNFRMPQNQKFSLEARQFSADYNSYYEFDSVIADNLRLLQYDIWSHKDNPTINIQPNDAKNQRIAIEVMNDCYIQFENYSVTLINNNTLTINVKYKARIDLYVTGTHYIFFSMYYICGDNFIPVNIYNFITIPDRIRLTLNYTGLYGVSIPADNYMTVSQFPSRITVEGHIQNINIPLSFPLYQNSMLILDENITSIQGSVIACYPNGQITTILTNKVYFEAYSIERLGETSGTIQCNPNIDFVLERYTNNSYISGQRSTISFRNVDISPGFDYHTNLAVNPHLYTNAMITSSGISYDLIEGSFTFPPGEKHIHLTFDSSIKNDIYFYRAIRSDSIPILCNRLKFDCNEWSVDLRTNTQDWNEIFPFSINKNCFINSLRSMQCLSVQFDQSGNVENMNQEIYVGNNVIDRSYNSLLSDETQNISDILDDSVNIINIEFGVQTTIDFRTFKDHSTLIIHGIDTANSNLNLVVSDDDRNIPLHLLVIDTCTITFNGKYIQADKVVFHNCLIENLTIDINTNDLSIPLELYSSEPISSKKFSSLTIFNKENTTNMAFSDINVSINSVDIVNEYFDTLCVYPMSSDRMTIIYNLIGATTSVKGISLNFSNYNVDDYYVINKPVQSQEVVFSFPGAWDAVQSLSSPFKFDLSGVITTFPQIPQIFNLNYEFDGGNLVFNNVQPFSIQNPIFLKQNLAINAQSEELQFSQVNIEKSIDFASIKNVSIQSLTVKRDVSVSLNPRSSNIVDLVMEQGSQINSRSGLFVNSATYYFDLEKVPLITANPPAITKIGLNFVNSSNSNPSNFIGIRHNILCSVNLPCSSIIDTITFNSNVNGVSSNQINDVYKINCTDPDRSNIVCMYIYLDNNLTLYFGNQNSTKKKVKPWVIAVAVLIPIIVIVLVIIIVILILVRRQKLKEAEENDSSSSVKETEKTVIQSKRRKKQAPIPPRKAIRWDPRHGRYIYHDDAPKYGNQSTDEDVVSENENETKSETKNDIKSEKVTSEETVDTFSTETDNRYQNQKPPSKRRRRKRRHNQDPENDSYPPDSVNGSDYF